MLGKEKIAWNSPNLLFYLFSDDVNYAVTHVDVIEAFVVVFSQMLLEKWIQINLDWDMVDWWLSGRP